MSRDEKSIIMTGRQVGDGTSRSKKQAWPMLEFGNTYNPDIKKLSNLRPTLKIPQSRKSQAEEGDGSRSLRSEKVEETVLEEVVSPSSRSKNNLDILRQSTSQNMADDLDLDHCFYDLSNVDMRFYRSIDYDSLGQDKEILVRDTWAMFKGSNVVDVFEIMPSNFSNFIDQAYKDYQRHGNTYHNFSHGVNVLNVCYFFLKEGNLNLYFDSLSVAALMFASLMHDVGHTGNNNKFEELNRSDLAILYNDTSILEMHHAALSFSILLVPDNNIFKSMDKEDFFLFRKYVIKGILSTDIKNHFADLVILKSRIDSTNFQPHVDAKDPKDFMLLFGVLVHCADLYTPTKNHPNSIEWARLLNQEFLCQVQKEKDLGLPVTPYYEKVGDPVEMAISEKMFIESITRPLWSEVDRFFEGKLSGQLSNIDKNHKYWDDLEKGDVNMNSISVVDNLSHNSDYSQEEGPNFGQPGDHEISQILPDEK